MVKVAYLLNNWIAEFLSNQSFSTNNIALKIIGVPTLVISIEDILMNGSSVANSLRV
jgi:hypothetical protein